MSGTRDYRDHGSGTTRHYGATQTRTPRNPSARSRPPQPPPPIGPRPLPPRLSAHGEFKYVVEDLLDNTEDDRTGRKALDDNESFFPNPIITFLIDQPENLTCQICQTQELQMTLTAHEPEDSTATILPCGHIACCKCLMQWLNSNTTCPFCRERVVHPLCGHNVRPRYITEDSIYNIPKTIDEGGEIGARCNKCDIQQRNFRNVSLAQWIDLANKFKKARREAEEKKTPQAEFEMKIAKEKFDNYPAEAFTFETARRRDVWL
ncbi:hypothetical protein GGR54DRAFT_647563 [Hypoxylon sp. NC1633]|nr:hypothetical protein GGR54DRAFT_647563 [Hypoxylon sp. NC1633]